MPIYFYKTYFQCIFTRQKFQYILGAVLPVLALVPPLRSPPPSGAGASGFFLACYIAACISFLVQKFVLSLIVLQNLVAVHGTNCWRYSDWGPLKDAHHQVRLGGKVRKVGSSWQSDQVRWDEEAGWPGVLTSWQEVSKWQFKTVIRWLVTSWPDDPVTSWPGN